MMKSIYETAGGTNRRQGDHELPKLKLPIEEELFIGEWERWNSRYLKLYRKILYYNLLTSGKLNVHLTEVGRQAENMFLGW